MLYKEVHMLSDETRSWRMDSWEQCVCTHKLHHGSSERKHSVDCPLG